LLGFLGGGLLFAILLVLDFFGSLPEWQPSLGVALLLALLILTGTALASKGRLAPVLLVTGFVLNVGSDVLLSFLTKEASGGVIVLVAAATTVLQLIGAGIMIVGVIVLLRDIRDGARGDTGTT
jgi:hypothetical protein